MSPYRISFIVLLGVLVLTGWLQLGTLLLSILFSFYAISKVDFKWPRGKWAAILVYFLMLGGLAYGTAALVQATVAAIPSIAEKSLPAVTMWATEHHIRVPFTNLDQLRDQLLDSVRTQAGNLGKFASFAKGTTTEFIYLTIGCMTAVGLYLNPKLDLNPPRHGENHNLYSQCCAEITRRFERFYESFEITMNAQVLIAFINMVMTGIFMLCLGLPHIGVALGVTFVTGLVPVVGNFISSVMLVAIGFVVSSTDGFISLGFVCVLHYVGFALSSKIIGAKIHSSFWLTLVALVVGESLMGVTGIVLAPVMLHYIRIEASEVDVKKAHPSKSGKTGE